MLWEMNPTINPRKDTNNVNRPLNVESNIYSSYAKACYRFILQDLEVPDVFKQWETLVLEKNLKKNQLEHKFECLSKSIEKKLSSYHLYQSIFDIYSKMLEEEKEKLLKLYTLPVVHGKIQVNRNKFGTILYPRKTRAVSAPVKK